MIQSKNIHKLWNFFFQILLHYLSYWYWILRIIFSVYFADYHLWKLLSLNCSVGTIPEVEEEEFLLLNTTDPDILELNTATGMVSLAAGESLEGVDSINFTVLITRTDNDTCKQTILIGFFIFFISNCSLLSFSRQLKLHQCDLYVTQKNCP